MLPNNQLVIIKDTYIKNNFFFQQQQHQQSNLNDFGQQQSESVIQIVTSENQTGTEQTEAGDQQAQNEEPQFVATAEMPSTSMENILETRLINLFLHICLLC